MEVLSGMKITKLSIVFVLIVLCCIIQLDIKTNNIVAINQKEIEYNHALEGAVDDAVLRLVDMDNSKTVTYSLNKDACINQFFMSLFASFGILDSPSEQKMLMNYIPVLAVTDSDGYFISFVDTYKDEEGSPMYTRVWSEKKPYYFKGDKVIFSFTFSDYIKIYDPETKEVNEGYFDDLKVQYPDEYLFQDKEVFDQIRRNSIVDCIQKDIKYYINSYNKIAENFGITYDFYLPVVDENDWQRTIDSISLFVVFQGYPYGYGTNVVYNRYAYAGARVKKADMYFITDNEGEKVYHRSDCSEVLDFSNPINSKKECALQGAYPCEKCRP